MPSMLLKRPQTLSKNVLEITMKLIRLGEITKGFCAMNLCVSMTTTVTCNSLQYEFIYFDYGILIHGL